MSAIKHDDSKPRMELLDPTFLLEVTKVLTFGAEKYEANNWRKGFKWTRLYGAVLRHVTAHLNGEDVDPESGLSHLAHAACGLQFLIWHEIHRRDLDDRYKQVKT